MYYLTLVHRIYQKDRGSQCWPECRERLMLVRTYASSAILESSAEVVSLKVKELPCDPADASAEEVE